MNAHYRLKEFGSGGRANGSEGARAGVAGGLQPTLPGPRDGARGEVVGEDFPSRSKFGIAFTAKFGTQN